MSKIAWTDESWNPIIGCSKVSVGCENCYAEKMAERLCSMGIDSYWDVVNNPEPWKYKQWNGETTFVESAIEKPLYWKKPRKIFVCSMGDFWHDSVKQKWRDRVYDVITCPSCSDHTFMFLTKRPENVLKDPNWKGHLSNVWLGVTAENQEMADKRIPILLDIPASKRFVSCEPLLGEISFSEHEEGDWKCPACGHIGGDWFVGCPVCCREVDPIKHYSIHDVLDWVIVGSESGAKRRECKPEWVDSIVKQCKDSGTACFVKQIFDGKKKIECPAQYPQEFPKGA